MDGEKERAESGDTDTKAEKRRMGCIKMNYTESGLAPEDDDLEMLLLGFEILEWAEIGLAIGLGDTDLFTPDPFQFSRFFQFFLF